MGAFLLSWSAPRRVPDLVRFTRKAEFRELDGVVAAWIDRQVALIERGAPWLKRAGRRVFDHCHTSMGNIPFTNTRDPRSVMCSRDVAVLYGFDGGLAARLTKLSRVLRSCGWGEIQLQPRDSPARAKWQPTGDLGYPPGLETVPPDPRYPPSLRMMIAWAAPGQSAESLAIETPWPWDTSIASPWYQMLEVDGPAIGPLAAQTLSDRQHALVMDIEVVYYSNVNVNVRPGRLRKKLLPVRNPLARLDKSRQQPPDGPAG